MRRWLVSVFVVLLVVPVSSVAAKQGALRPVDLRCEYRVNPLGVDAAAPRLSWKLDATSATARGLGQSAYRVVAATSDALLARAQGDLWDSGRVNSDRSIQVAYSGKPLSSGLQVRWKVQVWDNDGNPSAWSEPARWSMGLLAASDWKGKWIGLDGGDGKPQELTQSSWIGAGDGDRGTVYLRRTFEISQDNPLSASLFFLVASGPATFSFNGGEVHKADTGREPLLMDISGTLHTGTNFMAVSVKSAGNEPPALIGAIELNLADGQRQMLRTGQQWRVSSTAAPDWEKDSFRDSSWEPAKILGPYGMAPWGNVGWTWRTVLPARLLRKDFTAPARIRRATLYISGLGLSEAYLNGEKISQDVMSPALSEYAKRVFYITYDITRQLRPGANALGVMLGNGRYYSERRSNQATMLGYGFPKLRLQLQMELANGKVEVMSSDESWKLTTEGPIRANNEYDGEIYDARKEIAGWTLPGFADAGWQPAQLVDGPPGALAAQPIAPIRITESLKPISVHEVRPGVYVFDMGQNMVGWCRLTVAGPRGTKVTLRHAERLRPNGMLYVDNLRMAEATDTYILKGKGTEVYQPRFTYHGFRYVEVKGFPGKPALAALEGREVHDDLERASDFTTSNPLLNQIYRAVLWGTKDNYRSIPTDCPQRDEREGWLGDRSEESLGETYLFDVAAFYSKWIWDMHDAQQADGRMNDVAPSYWGYYADDVSWPSSFMMVADHLYRQYGDVRALEQNYPAMRKWIIHMKGYLKDDLMPRDYYGDWCVPPESPTMIYSKDPLRKTDGTLIGTAYFYHVLNLMEHFATLIGKQDDAREYSDLSRKLLVAFNKTYFHSTAGQYSNGSETSSVVPLAFQMVPEDERQKVADALSRKIVDEGKGHLATGLIGGQWLMQTLTDTGHADVAYQIAAQRTYPGWGYMVTHGGPTTIWELWNGDTADPAMNSGNHLMLVGDLIIWFYENLAGIRSDPEQPAFKHIIMRPSPVGDLRFVRADYNSSYGKIASDWKISGSHFFWNVTVPANASATVYMPANDPESVTESGSRASAARGVRYLRTEGGTAVYEVGSGSYRLESEISR